MPTITDILCKPCGTYTCDEITTAIKCHITNYRAASAPEILAVIAKMQCCAASSTSSSPILHSMSLCTANDVVVEKLDFHSPTDGSLLFTIYKDSLGNIIPAPVIVPCSCC